MVEGARLESVYTATYRGFESLPHRQLRKAIKYNGLSLLLNKLHDARLVLYSNTVFIRLILKENIRFSSF